MLHSSVFTSWTYSIFLLLMPINSLVCANVRGAFRNLIARVEGLLRANGTFDLLLCVGDFFNVPGHGDDELQALIDGELRFPIETHFIAGERPLPLLAESRLLRNQDQLAENVYFLGRRGLYTTIKGLTVAYLCGTYHPQIFQLGSEDDDSEILQPKSVPQESSEANNKDDMESNEKEVSAPEDNKDEKQPPSKTLRYYRKDDLDNLLSISAPVPGKVFTGVDILLTNEWPAGITRLSKVVLPTNGVPSQGRAVIAQIAARLRPRYHFAADMVAADQQPRSVFYEREPYRNEKIGSETEDVHVTRFFGLANVLNTEKMRPFYAMNITPMKLMESSALFVHPSNTTDFPFRGVLPGGERDPRKRGPIDALDRTAKRRAGVPPENYTCHICNIAGHWIEECPVKVQQQQERLLRNQEAMKRSVQEGLPSNPGSSAGNKPHVPRKTMTPVNNPQECWFCLMNPLVEKHLIASIGESCYLALAKGPLTKDHVLIIPIDHHRHSGLLSPEIVNDVEQYKKSVLSYFRTMNLGYVFFEVYVRPAHMHIQVIPIPFEKETELMDAFLDQGKAAGLEFEEKSVTSEFGEDAKFFSFGVSNGKQFVSRIRGKFSIQFGREVVAKALGIPEKADWKACKQTVDEEKEAAKSFKSGFSKYDFTLE